MNHWRLSGSTALVLLLSAPAALAVTPEEVWDNWQRMMSASGSFSAGTATRSGDTLEVTGTSLVIKNPDDPEEDSISTVLDRITFRDRGDGSVEITLPTVYPFTLSGVAADEPASFTVTTESTGLSMIASGTAEATSYDFTADSYGLTAADFKTAAGAPLDITVKAAMTGLAAKYVVTPAGEMTALETSGKAATATIDLVAKMPDKGNEANVTVTFGEISTSAKGNLMDQDKLADMSAALKAGFMIDSTSSVGPITVKGTVVDAGGPQTTIDAKLLGVQGKLALDAARVEYGVTLTGADMHVSGPEVPVPDAATAFGELSYAFRVPLAVSDAPQEFTALVKLVDLTAADGLWAMFDPGGQLKRDPATLVLDLKGAGRWTADILDPATQTSDVPPMELASLDLPQLLVRALGGEVAATGALTFDNTDLTTYGGVPAPTGKITANLKGINALIDTAVSMGLVPEDEVMGLRMGLAMFAKPGAGPDELVSEVEFKDKHLYVNGQMLQ